MFSYRKVIFDFTKEGHVSNKNLILVSGRNGFGKTSLLNSIKLLFHGPTKDLRDCVQRQRDISIKQYVLGVGEDWVGIMNSNARGEGDNHCWVKIHWQEDSGVVSAKRSWDLTRNLEEDLVGKLEIRYRFGGEPHRRISDEEAQNFINQRLPMEFVPFFFFDGEQITRLAEADDRKRSKQIERVLNISRLDKLTNTLKSIEARFKSEQLKPEAFEQKEDLIRERNKLLRKIKDRDRGIRELEEDIGEIADRIRTKKHEKDVFFSRLQKGEARNFEAESARIDKGQELAMAQLIELIPDLPLVTNPDLLRRCSKELGSISKDEHSGQQELLTELLEELPYRVFEQRPQPSTDPSIKQFYKDRLIREIETRILNYSALDNSFFKIDPSRAQALQVLFRSYLGDAEKARARTRLLEQIIQNKKHKAELERQALNHTDTSERDRLAYEELERELNELQQSLGGKRTLLNDLNNVVSKRYDTEKLREFDTQIDDLNRQIKEDELTRKKTELVTDLRHFFNQHKRNLRKSIGAALEESINRRFSEIMTSHKQIAHIALDHELFTWSFQDVKRQAVGKGNISAGMKQLAATAIIWALQEVSQANLPIIVDTPLARIDREHQLELLTRYYPAAGRQVIILPTSSELDREKYLILKPFIHCEYKLNNPRGSNTGMKAASMYPEVD